MGKLIDLTNKRFGRLFVVGRSGVANGEAAWQCWCDCGVETVVRGYFLRNGITQSCGCLHRELSASIYSEINLRHGKTGTREYTSWQQMLQRCTNPAHHAWKYYGERGIGVCDAWATSFETFLRDMGARPVLTSLDRIDVDGNYEPSNCRWADAKVQANNRRRKATV